MVKIINAVFLKVTTPELWPACVGITLPYLPLLDAMQYELEELCREQSFERRYGMTIDEAMSANMMSMAAARMAADDAPASAGTVTKAQCVEARG